MDFLSFAILVLSKIRSEKVPLKCDFIICEEIKTALQYFYLYLKLLLIELPWESTCPRLPMLEEYWAYNGFQFDICSEDLSLDLTNTL